MRTSIQPAVLVLASALAWAGDVTGAAGAAQGPGTSGTTGISVVGVASVQVKPSVVEISATLSTEAELANDARVKARDARQRVVDVLEAKCPGVAVESRGVAVSPQIDPALAAAMQRQQQVMILNGVVVQQQQNLPDANRRFGVTEHLRLVLKDADKLETPKLVETVARIIDAARESGLRFGPTHAGSLGAYAAEQNTPAVPLIVCKAADTSALRQQAYKAAVDDAKQKASRLAELAGVKVGRVTGIQELDAPAGGAQSAQSQPAAGQDAAVSSALIGELTLNVRLGVQFEVVK